MRPALFIVTCSLLCSCATIFNRKTTNFLVRTSGDSAQLIYSKEFAGVKEGKLWLQPETGASVPVTEKGVYIKAPRAKKTLEVRVSSSGGVEKTVYVKPVLSKMVYMNLAHLYPLLSAGLLVDCKSPKRFAYPGKIFVDFSDTGKQVFPAPPPAFVSSPRRPAYWDLEIAPPIANIYVYRLEHLDPIPDIAGLAADLKYHYARRQYLSFEAGAAILTFSPVERFPADSAYTASHGLRRTQKSSGVFATLKNNYTLDRFEFGYGLSAGWHQGDEYYTTFKQADSATWHKSAFGLGCALSCSYRVCSFLTLYVQYQPQLMSLSDGVVWNYESLVSAGAKFRVNLTPQR